MADVQLDTRPVDPVTGRRIGARPAWTRRSFVERPQLADIPAPSREGLDTAQADTQKFMGWIENPRATPLFAEQFGAGAASLSRARESARATERETAARRGYVGGYDPTAAEARRSEQIGASDLGFNVASDVATKGASLYEGAAGRFNTLLNAYNQQVSERNLAFAGMLAKQREQQATLDADYAARQTSQRQFEIDAAERARIEEAQRAEEARQFNVTSAERASEFATTSGFERQRLQMEREQFNEEKKIRNRELAIEERQRRLLGLPPLSLTPGRDQISTTGGTRTGGTPLDLPPNVGAPPRPVGMPWYVVWDGVNGRWVNSLQG